MQLPVFPVIVVVRIRQSARLLPPSRCWGLAWLGCLAAGWGGLISLIGVISLIGLMGDVPDKPNGLNGPYGKNGDGLFIVHSSFFIQ